MSAHKKYLTEEDRKAAKHERARRWREANPDYFRKWSKHKYHKMILSMTAEERIAYKAKQALWQRNYRQTNGDKVRAYQREYHARYRKDPIRKKKESTSHQRWYLKLKADPVRYEAYKQQRREYHRMKKDEAAKSKSS